MIKFLLFFLTQNTRVSTDSERYLLIYMICVLVIVTTLVVLFFIVFQKRKNKLLIEQFQQQKAFDQELTNATTEMQEQTLKNIGWELHDNVGQLLAAASMQLNILKTKLDVEGQENFYEASDFVKQSLKEVRQLSRSLNNEVVLNVGFEKSIENELNRLKKMRFVSVELKVNGDTIPFENKKHEIIIFRILQEFFSNSVKYSEAKNLLVMLNYQADQLQIIASDDGIGFDIENTAVGSGLLNMKSRAALINTAYKFTSKEEEGVTLKLDYSFS